MTYTSNPSESYLASLRAEREAYEREAHSEPPPRDPDTWQVPTPEIIRVLDLLGPRQTRDLLIRLSGHEESFMLGLAWVGVVPCPVHSEPSDFCPFIHPSH